MADHPHTVDRWDDAAGENLIEQIAPVGDYLVALETYRAAVRRWPGAKITLRNRARVIEQSWTEQRVNACMASSRDVSKPYTGSLPGRKAIQPHGRF
jgi:hypothetical protein